MLMKMSLRWLCLAAALLVILPSTETDDPAIRETVEYKFVPWPAFDPAMRKAFDRAAKKMLYNEECRCVIWAGGEHGIVTTADWPLNDKARWLIIEDIKRGFFIPPRRARHEI